MGSRIQKIAFLIFALMFVAIMAILNTSILTLGTAANGQLSSIVTSDDAALSIYDQQKVYGSTVVNCAKDPKTVGETIQNIHVITAADTDGETYDGTDEHKYQGTDATKAINKTAKFDSYLCANSNGVITGILFIQDGAARTGAETLVQAKSETAQGFTE